MIVNTINKGGDRMKVKTSVVFDETEYRDLQEHKIHTGMPINEAIRRAVRFYLTQEAMKERQDYERTITDYIRKPKKEGEK